MSSLSEEQVYRLKESVLVEKMSWLCDELGDPGRYFPELRSKRVLSVTDTQLIKSKPTDQDKIMEFVTLISKRRGDHGQHGLDVFIEALKKQRVHAHVARILVRTLNKKKAEAEKNNTPMSGLGYGQAVGTSPAAGVERTYHSPVHTSPSNGSDSSMSSASRYDVHPDHGALPPKPPPTSSSAQIPPQLDEAGNSHPQYGVRPPPPPPSSGGSLMVSPEEEVALQSATSSNGCHRRCVEDTHSHCSDELGPQSVSLSETNETSLSTDGTSMTTNELGGEVALRSYSSGASSRDSYPSLHSDEPVAAEVEQLRKTIEKLKYENKQLKSENKQLKEQLTQHRPSRLPFQPQPTSVYPVAYNLNPHTNMYYWPRNSSPSPGSVERDGPVLRPANSSGSLNSHGSRGSYNASESQV